MISGRSQHPDFEDEVDLIEECQTDSTLYRDTDHEKERLKSESRMKQKALDKASALIDLLNVELAVSRKAFQEALGQLSRDLERKQQQEVKLREKVRSLEQRNSFLQFECKKRVNEPKLSKSTSRTSFKSGGRSPSEENLRTTNKLRTADSIRQSPTPKKKKPDNPTMSVDFMKVFVQEYLDQDFEQANYLLNLTKREGINCEYATSRLDQSRVQLEAIGPTREDYSLSTQQKSERTIRVLRGIIQEHRTTILSSREVIEEYKHIVHQLLGKVYRNGGQLGLEPTVSILLNLNQVFPLKTKQVRDKISLSSKLTHQHRQNELGTTKQKLDSYASLTQTLRQEAGLPATCTQEQILEALRDLRANQKKLCNQNKELTSITEGLLKYIRY